MSDTIQPVKGTRDFYPEDMAIRTWLYNQIRQVSESFGYQEYEGPLLEPIELYAAKSGEELVKEQSFVFPDRGGNLITLRPELTPSLARLIAQRQQQLAFPVRWWSFGPMWRYERPQRGRSREFFQWNIDLLGIDTPEADAEIVATGASFLRQVGLTPDHVHILVNNRRLMDQELARLGIADSNRGDAIRLIDRRERMKPEAWKTYAIELGLTADQLEGLIELLKDGELWQKSDELVHFFSALEAMGVAAYVRFAPQIIRGLDYYTGTVFECFDRRGKFRAIFAGGRYDNLVADVGGDLLPGVGFAMGDKVLPLILDEYGLLPDASHQEHADVFITIFDAGHMPDSLRLATELRAAGLRVVCHPTPARLNKQLKHADRISAPIALILGPNELKDHEVSVKDLKNRSQNNVPRSEALAAIRQILARHSAS
jgi:histidyl-tRNA synthetase